MPGVGVLQTESIQIPRRMGIRELLRIAQYSDAAARTCVVPSGLYLTNPNTPGSRSHPYTQLYAEGVATQSPGLNAFFAFNPG